MIKFVLGFIALVFIGLALYIYTDKENKQRKEHARQTIVKTETPSVKKEVSVIEKKVVKKTINQKSLKVMSNDKKELGRSDDIPMEESSTHRTFETIEEIEEASNLTDTSGDDNTPMEFEPVVNP